jgi:prepilin-type N-terminal cleavage/methylation domain-containing protein
MWAKQKLISNRQANSGFTIVELLIVIVVIAILAAIVIVAYTGIQNKAHAAAAQAASNTVAKLLTNSYTTNGAYPSDLSTINNGGPMPTTDGSTYAYHPGAGNGSYCVTVTNGNSSYKVTDGGGAAVAGGCPGDGQGGVAPITNLVTNPSIETGTSTYGIGGVGVASSPDWASSGTNSLKLTPTGATSDSYTNIGGDTGAVRLGMQAGNTYTISANIYLPAPQTGTLQPSRARTIRVFTKVGAGSYVESGSGAPNSAGSTRLSYTFTVPVGATEAFIRLYNGSNSATDLVYWDGIMLTAGSTSYNYADGATPNWIWNGAANSSTSTGPPL